MRVLAFDPGYERLGVAVLEKDKLLFSDCIRTSAKLSFPTRLQKLGTAAEALIKQWQPDTVALEDIYFAKNEKTAMHIARVVGMLCYIAASYKLPVFEYTPMAIKIAITGYGKSDKTAVSRMIPRLVRLPARRRLDDEMDAIAVGLTCLASLNNLSTEGR